MARLTENEAQELQRQFPVLIAAKIDGKSLVVESELRNQSASRAHVYNVLWEYAPSGSPIAAPAAAYVCLEGDELRLGHILYPAPNRPLIVRIDPHLTALEPGRALSETMRFPLPIEEYSPYDPDEPATPKESKRASRLLMTYGLVVGGTDEAFVRSALTGGLQLIDGRLADRMFDVRSPTVPIDVAVESPQG